MSFYWNLECSCIFSNILEYFGMLWNNLEYSWIFWNISKYFGGYTCAGIWGILCKFLVQSEEYSTIWGIPQIPIVFLLQTEEFYGYSYNMRNFIRKNLEFHSLNLSLFFEKSYKMRNNLLTNMFCLYQFNLF